MIEIFFEDIPEIQNLSAEFYETWLSKVCVLENKTLGDVNLIFTSDEYLLEMNQKHLNHDYYTDIITFDYVEGNQIFGDLFISYDRVKDNAQSNNVSIENELNRVIVHGVLHLCGYKDKTEKDEKIMRSKEDEMLTLL